MSECDEPEARFYPCERRGDESADTAVGLCLACFDDDQVDVDG